MIQTFESVHPVTLEAFLAGYIATLPSTTTTIALPAEVNHGRWIVNCPFCNSADLASETARFFCLNCRNEAVGGAWQAVAWPKDRAKIEALLMARPAASTRQWKLPETAKDLARENAARGV